MSLVYEEPRSGSLAALKAIRVESGDHEKAPTEKREPSVSRTGSGLLFFMSDDTLIIQRGGKVSSSGTTSNPPYFSLRSWRVLFSGPAAVRAITRPSGDQSIDETPFSRLVIGTASPPSGAIR